jgi:hypothetical protein
MSSCRFYLPNLFRRSVTYAFKILQFNYLGINPLIYIDFCYVVIFLIRLVGFGVHAGSTQHVGH